MSRMDTTYPTLRLSRSSLKRWTLAVAGVCCVAICGVGAIVPGLPTTVFLIAACWCFTRSCPWMENILIRNRLFRPFLAAIDNGADGMPRRAKAVAIVAMWIAIAVSVAVFAARIDGLPMVFGGALLIAGLIGTWSILRFRGGAWLTQSVSPRSE